MDRGFYLDLAKSGLCMPIAVDLGLHAHADVDAILLDGNRLGEVVVATAREHRTPLAFPLMDLTIEKSLLLELLGVEASKTAAHHLSAPPSDTELAGFRDRLPGYAHARLDAACGAIVRVAEEADLVPCGMVIGPMSLVVKLIHDPILALYQAGQGDAPALLEVAFEMAQEVIEEAVRRQILAGAKAVVVCEPAASTAYISPRQLRQGSTLLDRYVEQPNMRLAEKIRAGGAELVFHCCGELTAAFVESFARLRPVMLSLGGSRNLWEDADLIPRDIVLYGNLPSKLFYSDDACPVEAVERQAAELVARMREKKHPFILGTECDVLSVEGARERIIEKIHAMARVSLA